MTNEDMNQVREFYEKTAEDYDKEYEAPRWKLYDAITWQNIKQFLPKKKSGIVLDAGGTGHWTIKLAKQGYRVMLTDISENMLKVAKRRIKKEKLEDRIETRIADIRNMSCFTSNQFDMALAEGDPVSYCLDPEKAIMELTRVVKPNAPVIVSVDSKHPIISRLIAERSYDALSEFLRTGIVDSRDREFKLQAFSPEKLRILFKKCGLRTVRVIGKPILIQLLPREERDQIVRRDFKRVLGLELKFCDVPSLVGVGGHLEAVGIKQE